jgi:hypothetical protein
MDQNGGLQILELRQLLSRPIDVLSTRENCATLLLHPLARGFCSSISMGSKHKDTKAQRNAANNDF